MYPEIRFAKSKQFFENLWKGQEHEQVEDHILMLITAALQRLKIQGESHSRSKPSLRSLAWVLSRLEGYASVNSIVEQAVADHLRISRRETKPK